ncbi:MAG: hypothetical protein C5B55_08480 [Blastocatellia bacterium]|nr:MAG: hypothetical protein C5B55_08480 [Blastocatellia bacterium]
MSQHVNEVKEPYRRLAEINRAITTSLNFDQVLNLIVENAAQLVGAPICLLLLLDKNEQLRIRASRGIDDDAAGRFSGHMEEEVVKDLYEFLKVPNTGTLFTVPIIAKRSLTGLLVITRHRPLDQEEEWQLSALADQAAIAMGNARLYEMELAEATRERDETMQALRDSNKRIQQILESITDLFYSLDREWRFTDVNRQTELRFGKNSDELIGRVIWEVYPEAIDSPLYENFQRAVKEDVPVHFEVASKIVPGTWFEAHAYPSNRGLTVYLRDISERKEAEVTSRLIAAIVASSDDAIVSKDLNGIINSWNKSAERIFGYSAEEVMGKSITIIIPEDRLFEEPVIMERIRHGESVDHFETIRQRKDGRRIHISLTISPVRDESGVIIGASKIARDITREKLAQEEINFQARMLSAVEQAVIATDLSGTITSWNRFAEHLYGWPAAEAIGMNIVELTPINSRVQAEEIFAVLSKGQSWSGEMTLRRRDGSEFPAMITDSPITNDNGELIGIVGISVDITELKRSQEEKAALLRAEREARADAEAANRLKDEFLATLSHELRNPLNVVIGYSEILRRSNENENRGFVRRAAEVIRRNALAQSQLVSDLLDLSRLQMGKLAINRQPVSLSTIISDAIETVKAEAIAKEVSLKIDCDLEPLLVNADPVRLGQIAWNLLNNAVKFTPAGGAITIGLSKQDGCARLMVQDTGQGIAPEFLPHVFEIFRQADASSSRRQGGLGIGLALVKQLTELHGGRVEVYSEGLGKGARFVVVLPLEEVGSTNGDSARVTSDNALSKKNILVVDDSTETTDMLRRLLQMEGARVHTARSGLEALELAHDTTFDLVISDISMPEMDGYQLLRNLRRLPPMHNVPALALTGYGRATDVLRAKREGFAQHFTKPLDIDKLLTAVRELTQTTCPSNGDN